MCHRNALRSQVLQTLLAITMVATTMSGFVGPALGQAPLAQLKVISVRKVSNADHTKRASRTIGSKYVVRLRLEVGGDQGVYVLLLGSIGTPPLGYAVERNTRGVVWLDGDRGEDQSTSPGVERLKKRLGARWILFPASATYEWEIEADSSGVGTDESRSIFIRADLKRPPTELLSSWFKVGDNRGILSRNGLP